VERKQRADGERPEVLSVLSRNRADASAPGGPSVPLAASAIIVGALLSQQWQELIAALGLVLVALVYLLQERMRVRRSRLKMAEPLQGDSCRPASTP